MALLAGTSFAQSTPGGFFDDFLGTAFDPARWATSTTGSDSSITISSGNAIFRNRGRLTTQQSFSNIVVSGRIRFTGSASDVFKIILRTDGAMQNTVYQEAANGIVCIITSSSNWDSDATRNVYIGEINGTNAVTGGLVLPMQTYHDFRIVDDGSRVTAYVGNLTQPVASLATTLRAGNRVAFYNRERIGSILHTTEADSLQVQPMVRSSTRLFSCQVQFTAFSFSAGIAQSLDDSNKTAILTTYNTDTPTTSSRLGYPNGPFSGEVMCINPTVAGYFVPSDTFKAQYLGYHTLLGGLVNYGVMTLQNMPITADVDGDGLPDFLEVSQGSNFSVQATEFMAWQDSRVGSPYSSSWTFQFQRSAGSEQGIYRLRASHEALGWQGSYWITTVSGPCTFDEATGTISGYVTDSSGTDPLTLSGSYSIESEGSSLRIGGMAFSSSLGTIRSGISSPVWRLGSDRGTANFSVDDGDPTTPYPDYQNYHMEITSLDHGIFSSGQSPVFTSTNSFSVTVGVAFSNTVTASGSTPITFRGSNLPSGLNLATNGLISGTPTTAGTNNATLTASNSFGVTTQAVTFVIAKGVPVISNWPTASPITYGQAVSNSVLSGGVANPTDNFTWTVPTNRPNAGTNSQSVTFTPAATNNYNSVSTNISLVVNKATPTLTWTPSPAASLTYPAPLSSTQLNATSTVAGNWSYNLTNGSVLNAGTNTLVGTFTPADTTNHVSGLTITNTVVVAKGSQNIIFGALPVKYVGDAAFNLTATASSGLTVTYTSSNTNVATVLGNLMTIVGEGTTTITASQAGNSNWNAATPVTQTLTVQPAINRGLVAYYPFNGNANDESGNGKNGVVNGATLANDRFGVVGKSFSFSGGGDHIRVEPAPNLHSTGSWSATVWVNISSGGVSSPRFVCNGTVDIGVHGTTFAPFTGNARAFGGGWGIPGASTPDILKNGQWYFFATVFDGTFTRLYLDGREVAVSPVSGGVPEATSIPLGIGRNLHSGGDSFAGRLDEVRLYNRHLSTAEISQLYQQEAGNLDTDGDGLTDAWERGYGRYQLIPGQHIWTEAKSDAENRGGHLATITSQAEWDFVLQFLRSGPLDYQNQVKGWLGGTDLGTEGTWRWVTGEAFQYSDFHAWEPNRGPDENCLAFDTADGGGWFDADQPSVYFSTSYPWPHSGYLLEFGYPTDPTKSDTDGDGFDDRAETIAGTDPNSATAFPDTQAPLITLVGNNPLEIFKGSLFTDPGAAVTDNKDSTRTITGTGPVDTSTVGIYTLTYTAQDAAGNLAVPVTRTVNVVPGPEIGIVHSLRVRALIDGPSQLILSPEGIRWRHWDWTAVPGRHEGRNDPTYLNDEVWYPAWPQEGENRNYDAYSSFYTGFDVSPFLSAQNVSLQIGQARDTVLVTQEPSGEIRLTILYFDDLGLGGSDNYDVTISVAGTPPVITSTNSLLGQVGAAVSYPVTASGTTPITFGASNLPVGLNIATNGLISGTPTTAGSGTATITATNAFGTNSASLAWTIAPRTVLTISGASVPGKMYDGTRGAGVEWSGAELVGVGTGHEVQLVTDNAVAEYGDANAGTGKAVSVTGLSLAGADAGRYELGPVLLLSGEIGKRALSIGNLSVLEKRYDGSVAAPLSWSNHVLSGYATNEGTNEARVAQPYARGKYTDALVGTNKTVIGWFELPVLEGTGSANYRLLVPTNLAGTVLKGWAGIEIQATNQVYGRTNRVVAVATTNLTGTNPVLEVVYEGTNGTVYGPSSNGPVNAGQYRVVARVAETDNTYEGTTNALLVIQKRGGAITAQSDTIRAGTVFGGSRYTAEGFLEGDEPTGTLATHLRSVTNTNPPVSYVATNNQSGVYRILRGSVGDNVTNNYQIEHREGILTVLKESLLTEGAVAPLGAGLHYTLVVQSNATVRAFGSNSVVVSNVPSLLTNGTAEVAGVGSGAAANFGLAWTRDGVGLVWGSQSNTLGEVAGMAGGNGFVAYQRANGTAATWGSNLTVPVPGSLTNSNTAGVVGVAAGDTHVLAVRTNGAVVGWGTYSGWGTNLGAVPALSNAVGVGAGQYHGVALRGDGTVAVWGSPSFEVTNVPGELTNRSATNFVRAVAVAAGYTYTLVLRADGSVRGWGQGAPTNLPVGLTGSLGTNPIVNLAVEQHHAVALQRDGTVTTWWAPGGINNTQTLTVPAGLKGRVPMGGADSDRDGWANEAELRVGSDPLSTNSVPVKASFGVNFAYGSNGSTFRTSTNVVEGTNRVVGTLAILDSMGRVEDGNQAQMSVELSEEGLRTFEPVSRTNRTLRFKADPVHDGAQTNANTYRVDVLVKDSELAAPLTTTLTVTVGNVAPQITGTTSFGVDENLPAGTVVGTVQASEGGVTWSLAEASSRFAIDAASGVITTLEVLDYEALADKTITLQVRVSDTSGAMGSAPVTIAVRDVNEDAVAPVITLVGANPARVGQNGSFTDPGARVSDNVDAERTIYASGTVDTSVLGSYLLTYTASDSAGNAATPVTRTVIVDGWAVPIDQPGWPLDPGLLAGYALGGATVPGQQGTPAGQSLLTDTNTGQRQLVMSALVRTNDTHLTVRGQVGTSLTQWSPNELVGQPAADQTGVPPGFERQVFITPPSTNRQFLRLKVSR